MFFVFSAFSVIFWGPSTRTFRILLAWASQASPSFYLLSQGMILSLKRHLSNRRKLGNRSTTEGRRSEAKENHVFLL